MGKLGRKDRKTATDVAISARKQRSVETIVERLRRELARQGINLI